MLKLIQEPSISVPSWEGRGVVDTEVSSLKLVGEDMAGTKTTIPETELEVSNVVCMVVGVRGLGVQYKLKRKCYFYRLRV